MVLKARLLAETAERVTAPAVPVNTASLPSLHVRIIPRLLSHQFATEVLQTPEPPRFAPVDALFPAIDPSVSHVSVAAPAPAPAANCNTATMTDVVTATVCSVLRCGPAIRFAMRFFKNPMLGTFNGAVEAPQWKCQAPLVSTAILPR